ncbi:MAG TPA: DciA family protein [Dongiaceae bacterium]|nr:DciA family protein [Dongiaceae bacterium]
MTTNTKKPADQPGPGQKSKAAAEPAGERRGAMAALAVNVPAVTRAAIGSRGFAEAGLITHWAEIIGPELARGCQPDKLRFPKGERSGGTLTLRCIGAMALELQHQTPLLIERINSYFGYRAIAQLRLIQGSLRRQPQRRVTKLPPLAPIDRAATEAKLSALPESDIKDALRRLGDAIRQRAKSPAGR